MPFLKQAFVRAFLSLSVAWLEKTGSSPHPQALSFACEFLLKYDV